MEYNDDLEKQYNLLSSRLQKVDQRYRYEQTLIQRMVKRLKKSNVSVVKAFEKFDTDGDGYITRAEMANAIQMIGFDDMSIKDVDILIDSMDTDKNGLIEYKEFHFMLMRSGLKTKTVEETLVFNIIKTIQKMGRGKAHMFELIDKDGKGYITRIDFKDFLDQLKHDQITDHDIENFINYFYKQENGDINLQSFIRIFSMYEKKMKEDD